MTVFLRARRDLTLIGESTAMAIGGSLRGCGVRQDSQACPDHKLPIARLTSPGVEINEKIRRNCRRRYLHNCLES